MGQLHVALDDGGGQVQARSLRIHGSGVAAVDGGFPGGTLAAPQVDAVTEVGHGLHAAHVMAADFITGHGFGQAHAGIAR